MCRQSIWELSVLSTPLCYEPKSALKIKFINLKNPSLLEVHNEILMDEMLCYL